MATYAIGDIHGCFLTLQHLLHQIKFSSEDRLWLVGDLVNRGPRSLEVLRWARDRGEQVVTVLGNHDIHLLKSSFSLVSPKKREVFSSLLAAEDSTVLLDWLRYRPLIHIEKPYVLVHAGLLPQWSIEEAEQYGHEVEGVLRGPQAGELLTRLNRKRMSVWDDRLAEVEKHSSVLRVMTELRALGSDERTCLDFAGPLHELPKGTTPWFSAPSRKSRSHTIVFGHWAALGFYRAPGILALDSGCAWGGMLTAVRLEDHVVFQQANVEDVS